MEDFFAYRLIIEVIQGVHLSQVHQQCNKSTDITLVHFSLLVHFLLWQAAKPSGDKCTPLVLSDIPNTKNRLAWRSSPSEAIFVCCMISQLRRYSDGDMPVCSLKYLPRNDWLEKFSSCAISLMLFCVLRSSIRRSMVT